MGKASRILGCIIIGSFILGIALMALAESVLEEGFGIGLLLFLLGVSITTIWVVWSTAGWMERQTRKF